MIFNNPSKSLCLSEASLRIKHLKPETVNGISSNFTWFNLQVLTYNVSWYRVILTRSFTLKPCMKQCCDYSLVERFQKKKKTEEKNSRSYSHSFQSLKRKQKYLQIRVSSATDYLNYWQNKNNIFWCKNTVKSSLSICEHFLWRKTKKK